MANHNLPTTTSLYTDFVTQYGDRLNDITLDLDSLATTPTNLPTGAVRWNATNFYWEKWSGSAWAARSSRYDININGTVGASAPASGAFTTLSSNSTTALAAGTTIGGVAAVTTTGTQTLTNKTLTTPNISSILNGAVTLTLPTTTDTIVGRATTDTLTNKTLTAPKFANAGYIADPNGNEYLEFASVASAVNFVRITNAATATAVQLSAQGTDTDVSLNITAKGVGTVQVAGAPVVTTSATQTLTNKTLTTPSITSIVNGAFTITIPSAATDTLVARSTTDTLSNKTLTAPRFASGGFIADANGNEQIILVTTASAVNEITVTNAAAGTAPSIASTGTDTNIDLNLVAKGSGVVKANGVEVVTVSGSQTLTDKTWNGSTIAVAYGGTGASTAAGARTNLGVPGTDGSGATGTWNISVTGNAGTVTNGVYTTGDQTIGGIKTFSNTISGSISGNAGTVTNGVYTTGDQTIGGAKSFSGKLLINKTTAVTVGTASGSDQFELQNNGTGACIISFHRAGAYAINMGLDTDNVFRLGGWSNGTNVYRIQSDTSGNFTAQGNITAYSDERIKKDWLPLCKDFLLQLSKIKFGTYTRIDTGERQVGVSAQDLQKILKESVFDDGKYLSVAYGNVALVACIKLAQEVLSLREQLSKVLEV